MTSTAPAATYEDLADAALAAAQAWVQRVLTGQEDITGTAPETLRLHLLSLARAADDGKAASTENSHRRHTLDTIGWAIVLAAPKPDEDPDGPAEDRLDPTAALGRIARQLTHVYDMRHRDNGYGHTYPAIVADYETDFRAVAAWSDD